MSDTLPKGLLMSPTDYELVSEGLTALAAEARRQGRDDVYQRLARVIVRMRHCVFAGSGVENERLSKMAAVIEKAFSIGDYDQATRSIAAMIEATIRMDPDPASQVARHLAPTLVRLTVASAKAQQNRIGAHVLRQLQTKRLAEDKKAFEEGGWASGSEMFDYVVDTVDFCASELDNDIDPFSPESPSEPDPDAADVPS